MQEHESKDDMEFSVERFITPQLKAYLAERIGLQFQAGKRRSKFNTEVFTDHLIDACNDAAEAQLIPEHVKLPVGILLSVDEDFYIQTFDRTRAF